MARPNKIYSGSERYNWNGRMLYTIYRVDEVLTLPKSAKAAIKNWLLSNIEINDNECWNWQGKKDVRGYGILHTKTTTSIHRLAYVIFKGSTNDLFVLHECDNPPCINPAHLWLGTNQDNMQDMSNKGRASHKSVNKHESNAEAKLTTEQVILIRKLYWNGKVSQQSLAVKFKVSQSQIGRIVRRVNWK